MEGNSNPKMLVRKQIKCFLFTLLFAVEKRLSGELPRLRPGEGSDFDADATRSDGGSQRPVDDVCHNHQRQQH